MDLLKCIEKCKYEQQQNNTANIDNYVHICECNTLICSIFFKKIYSEHIIHKMYCTKCIVLPTRK
jgi:hypothetical protein